MVIVPLTPAIRINHNRVKHCKIDWKQRSKHDIDEQLLAMPIDSTVLMPSLVFGAHGASSRAFLGLALMPLLLLPGGGWQRVQPIHRDDLVDAIAAVVASGCGHGRLAMVGPRCITIAEYLSALRTGLGFSPPAVATLPAWAIRSANALRIGGGLLDREALAMLDRGNCADAGPIGALLGRAPRAPEQFVAGTRAMLRRETIVAAAMPLLRIALALMWIGSAFASWLYPRALSLELLHRSGVHGSSAVFALHAAAMLDLLLGAALFARSLRAPAYAAQLALMLGYTAWISVFLPEFWLHPYAPILKNVPIAVLTWFMWQMERRDGLPDA